MSLPLRSLHLGLPVFAVICLLLIWECASRNFVEYAFILPPPSAILECLIQRADRFFYHTNITFQEMTVGLLLATLAAFPLAWIMWNFLFARRLLHPLFVVIQCIPMFTLAPIMVIWFGWSFTAIVIPTAIMIFFPLTMNIYQGFCSVPPHLLHYFRIQQATTWQILIKLQLPWAAPHIFSGFRISTAIAGIGAVAGEWAGGQAGLGVLMTESRRATDLTTTFGALACLATISLFMYGSVSLIEKKVFTKFTRPGIALLLFLFSLVVSSCQQKENKTETTLLLDWLPNPNHVAIYAGITQGFFQEQGISLSVRKLQDPSDTIPYLTSHQADLALYYMPNVIVANQRGARLIPIGILFKQPLTALIYKKNIGIESMADLNERTIGYCADGTDTAALRYILRKNQIQPRARLNVSFDLVSALGTGQVDALYGAYWNIECEHLKSLGINTGYFTLQELGFPNYYELLVLATQDTHHASAPFIEKFQIALQKSIDFSKEHPDIAFQNYQAKNPDKSPATLTWEYAAWQKTAPLLANDQLINPEEWQNFSLWMQQQASF